MKKSLLKNLIALAFSLGALVFMAGNVFANSEEEGEIGDLPPGTYIDGVRVYQSMSYCGTGSIYHCCTPDYRPYNCSIAYCIC